MARVEVVMPKMGESVMEGTVLTWHKQPGDAVEVDETLLEIGTDKVDSEIPSPAEGILQEILVPEGETVEVGTVIAIIGTEVDADAPPPQPTAPTPTETSAPEPEPVEDVVPAAPAQPAAQTSSGSSIDVVMPKMGESVMEGTVLTWHKQPGDAVEVDETLLEIGTDKVDSEIPSPVEGILQEILVPEGETVEVGTVLARIGSDVASQAGQPTSPSTSPQPAPEPVQAATPPVSTGDGAQPVAVPAQDAESLKRHGSDGRFYSPLVRSIASTEGVTQRELESVTGSGKDGRVTKTDILNYIENRKQAPPSSRPQPSTRPTPAPAASYGDRTEIIEMDRMRQIIAEHMTRSLATSAHVTSFTEADVTNLVRLRDRNKRDFLKREGVRLTYTPFFVKAALDALREHPLLNASVDGKRIIIKKDFHIGIAVAIDKTGLVVPVIRDAQDKNIVGLVRAAAGLADRARNKQLQPDEIQGGTFTVTNIGSLGSLMGTPIINQPQVAILASGAIKKRPVVVEDPVLGDVIAIRHMAYLTLTYDHRIIDGAMAASFLRTVVNSLEQIDPDATL